MKNQNCSSRSESDGPIPSHNDSSIGNSGLVAIVCWCIFYDLYVLKVVRATYHNVASRKKCARVEFPIVLTITQ